MLTWTKNSTRLVTEMLLHQPSTIVIAPKYLGGPWDGGIGPLEPPPASLASLTITMRGGRYVLEGFERDRSEEYPVDRAVYRWEVAK